MKIVWDEPERMANLANRGFDFADLDAEFFASARLLPGYEERFMAIGEFEGVVVTVIFKPFGREALSVISMRRASRRERQLI